MLPIYRDETYLLCDMPLAKGYSLIHAIGEQNGVETAWADEEQDNHTSVMQQVRSILQTNG